MRYVLPIVVVFATFAAMSAWLIRNRGHRLSDADATAATERFILTLPERHEDAVWIIHAPATGCPEGWTPAPGLFSQRDGTTRDACYAGTLDLNGPAVSIDYMNPGEGVSLPFLLWTEEEKPVI